MTRINSQGYIERRSRGGGTVGRARAASWRNWWLVKHHGITGRGMIALKQISIPSRYVGKRIRFKVEVVEE